MNVTFIDKYGFCTCLSSHLNLPSWKFCGGQFVFLTTLKIVSCTPSLRDFGKFSLQLISKLRQINDLLQVYTFHFLELFVKWRLLLFVFHFLKRAENFFCSKQWYYLPRAENQVQRTTYWAINRHHGSEVSSKAMKLFCNRLQCRTCWRWRCSGRPWKSSRPQRTAHPSAGWPPLPCCSKRLDSGLGIGCCLSHGPETFNRLQATHCTQCTVLHCGASAVTRFNQTFLLPSARPSIFSCGPDIPGRRPLPVSAKHITSCRTSHFASSTYCLQCFHFRQWNYNWGIPIFFTGGILHSFINWLNIID